jgi:hypothetical protein
LRGQSTTTSAWHSVSLLTIGSSAEDLLRLDQLRGKASTAGFLIRSASTLTAALDSSTGKFRATRACLLGWAAIMPDADVTYNSAIPFDRNDGAMWAGRGMSLRASGGVRAQCRRVRVYVAPEIWSTANRAFALVATTDTSKSGFANPFYSGGGNNGDLPLRFGTEPLFVLDPGESAIEVDAGRATFGLGTQPQWWGPAIRNAVMMSNHAAGIPSFYVRTARPIDSPLGRTEARWMVGALSESPFFDFNPADNLRSLSGLVITQQTRVDSGLTFGIARVVYAIIPSIGALPARFLDALGRWGPSGDVRTAKFGRAAEQLAEVFGRWVLPESGVEAYAEWARVILPRTSSELFVAPQKNQGYTLGMQWVGPGEISAGAWRVQAELTDLEQPLVSRGLDPASFYVSPIVRQGYTQRGQVIGAAIGPGSSSQWLALDRMDESRSVGAFVGRIRWNTDVYYRMPTGFSIYSHDVSLYAGVRGRLNRVGYVLSGEALVEKRLNYLFQSTRYGYDPDPTFDVTNFSMRFRLERGVPRRRAANVALPLTRRPE